MNKGQEMQLQTVSWKRVALGVLTILNILTALVTLPIVFYSTKYEVVEPVLVKTKSVSESNLGRAYDDSIQPPAEMELWQQLELESVRDPLVRNLLAQERKTAGEVHVKTPWKRLRVISDRHELKQRDSGKIKNNITYEVLIRPEEGCNENTVLLIAVCSAIQHFDLRDAIRQTWGSYAQKLKLGVRVVFFLGHSDGKFKHLQPKVIRESDIYGDIIQNKIVDSYRNLTLKTLVALKWSREHCSGAKFLMKADDDIFVNIPNLLNSLEGNVHMLQQKFILGYIIKDASPIKDRYSKWFTPDSIFRGNTYPTYASGSAYIISSDLINDILASAQRTRLFWLEDVYITGILAKQCGTTLIHNDGFTYRRGRSGPCHYLLNITGHQITAEEMLQIWKDIHTRNLACAGV